MLLSHMDSKGQRWPDSNIRLGEIGDVSSSAAGFHYGFSDIMMNNLWGYDFNMLDESQHNHFSGFPGQGLSDFMVSDVGLSSSFAIYDVQHNLENDDPNSIKVPISNVMEKIETKVAQTCIKGTRSKRSKRTVCEGSWNFSSTPSLDRNGSVDNQGSVMSKRTSVKDVSEPILKKRKGKGSADNQGSVMSKRTFLSDASDPISKKRKGQGSVDNQGSVMSKRTFVTDMSEPAFKKQKGANSVENNEIISESVGVNSVGRWLEDVGFGRYAGVFEMHEVDEEALPLLTLDDLKEMGVLAVGARRKLYAAICGLKGQCETNSL
ncbi:Sterile alpha motif domain-containing protein [Artemisia annua]|uniref:Sterile alpha motif domain-containing protein n=1 Tax=Artemisia annua TaxID=35608 RepID=A0A2U1MIX8_ARTAN|nr:Sterile alpha motif domain-containing protein [Artemisia annua]